MAGYPISRYAHERITKEVVEATYKATKKVFYESGYAAGKAEGIKEGMRRAAEICRARAVKLAPEHTAHTEDGCYDCGAEDEADYLALAILKEAGE